MPRLAYQRKDILDRPQMVEFSEWRGVTYPAHWRDVETAGLLVSVHAANCHGLAEEVSDRS